MDVREFTWPDRTWQGLNWADAVIYEMHVGTFTEAGTLCAAMHELPRLKSLGITFVELMPLAQFDGQRGWGYDGVLPWCLHNAYGTPQDLRAFVATAHGLGMGVLLDVVHNHLGPSGNYLASWCPSFFHVGRSSTWGEGIAWEIPAVRAFFIDSALAWLEDYGFDGLRLDAVHAIDDRSPVHFLDELGQCIRAREWGRQIHLVTEDERNTVRYFTPDAPFDGTWNDDWHHAVHCLLTGEDEGYYAPYARDPVGDIEIALRDGYVEQGQVRSEHAQQQAFENPAADRRGEPSGTLPRTAFVNFLGNHDQIGNRAWGERLHHLVDPTPVGRHGLKVAYGLTLLSPFVPMLFMGDEFLTDAPFLYFCDFSGDLADAVRSGRAEEFAQFSSFGGQVPDPLEVATFEASRIGLPSREEQRMHEAFLTRLLKLRASHVAPLLRSNTQPVCDVAREGATIEALWDFGGARIALRAKLGGGSEEFVPFEHSVLTLEDPESPFALSFAVSSRHTGETL